MKKSILIVAIAILAVIGVYMWNTHQIKKVDQVQTPSPVVTNDTTDEPINKASLCFYQEKKTQNNLFDRQILKLNILGEKVTGEYKYLPAEKDSKVGTFEGVVGKVDKQMMARTADLWWNVTAEGMQVNEQLRIIFGEGNAETGFGEMTDGEDGTYVYKDSSKLTYGPSMTDVACDDPRLSVK